MKKSTVAILCLLCIHYSPAQHKIYTSDIDNFWIAFDSVQQTSDTPKMVAYMQHLYMDKASDGLKEFMVSRNHTAQKHVKNILRYPQFWHSVRPFTNNIAAHTPEMEQVMQKFAAIYPGFRSPEIYFLIGTLNSGGTTTENKVLIGAEISAADSTVNTAELSTWLRELIKYNGNIVQMVAHETVHTQQVQDQGKNPCLLSQCLMEGACDFIAELLLGQEILSAYMSYGKQHEKEIWKNFRKEMRGKDIQNWLYNGGETAYGQADLGYFTGYMICKNYYDKSPDKSAAIREIITMKYSKRSALKFLKASGYQGGM